MANLRARFPVYSKLLRLYPKGYRRKYETQLLQTLADMLDDSAEDRANSFTIWKRTVLDFLKSVPKEHIRAVKPAKFIKRSLVLSFLLILPLLSTVGYGVLFPASDPISDRKLIEQLWYSQIGYSLWGIVLPLFATVVAMTALAVWRFHTRKNEARKNRRLPRLALASLVVISLSGLIFLGFISTMWVRGNQKYAREVAASRRSQAVRPALACSLLPEHAAKTILSKDVYLHNSINGPDGPFNGFVVDDQKTQVTTCQYHADPASHDILIANAAFGKTPEATNELKAQLLSSPSFGQSISLHDYQGRYYQGQGTFSLELWVKDHRLGIVAESFEKASQVMSEMIKNLEHRLATPQLETPDALPSKLEDLSKLDQTALAESVQSKEPSIQAGTNYDVEIQDVSGSQVKGLIHYDNGVKGEFTAEKRKGIWHVTEYKRL